MYLRVCFLTKCLGVYVHGQTWFFLQDLMQNAVIKRRPHQRTCFRKTTCSIEQRMKRAQGYLSSIGVDWPAWQRMHSRSSYLGFGFVETILNSRWWYVLISAPTEPYRMGRLYSSDFSSWFWIFWLGNRWQQIHCHMHCYRMARSLLIYAYACLCMFWMLTEWLGFYSHLLWFRKLPSHVFLLLWMFSGPRRIYCNRPKKETGNGDKGLYCPGGGFQALRQKLLTSDEVKCHVCLDLLKGKNFNQVNFDSYVAGELPLPLPPVEPSPSNLGSEGDAANKDEEPQLPPQTSWRDWVANFSPVIELLAPGSFGKALPFRCQVCITKRWPNGKVGDLCIARLGPVKHFLLQHLNSNTHKQNVQRADKEHASAVGPEQQKIDCKGIFLDDSETARHLHKFKPEMELWLSMANFGDHPCTKHEYNLVDNKWHLRSGNCLKQIEKNAANERLLVCEQCLSLGAGDSIVRSAQRFALKYYAAELLSARLFAGEQAATETFQKISETPLYKSAKFKIQDVLKHSTSKLQIWVRAAWTCDSKPSAAVQRFLDTVIQPSLAVSTASVPERLADVSATFEALLKGADCTDEQLINMQVAAAAIKGQFEHHPLLLGLTLQTTRMLEKQERGLTTMRGRRSKESDTAASLIRDSGLQLAVATGNNTLVREFGISKHVGRIAYSELERHSLPSPALALNYPSKLEMNFVLADQRFVRKQGTPKRSLALLGWWRGGEMNYFWIFMEYLLGFTKRDGLGQPMSHPCIL